MKEGFRLAMCTMHSPPCLMLKLKFYFEEWGQYGLNSRSHFPPTLFLFYNSFSYSHSHITHLYRSKNWSLVGINTSTNMNFIYKHCKGHKKFISWFDIAVWCSHIWYYTFVPYNTLLLYTRKILCFRGLFFISLYWCFRWCTWAIFWSFKAFWVRWITSRSQLLVFGGLCGSREAEFGNNMPSPSI